MEQLQLFKIKQDDINARDYIITKANTLVEANYRLTLTQQRIILLMASMVQPDDEDFKLYRLTVGDFMDLLDITRPNLYAQMVGMVDHLMRVVLTIRVGEESYVKTHWIDKARYTVGTGYIDITFDPELKPFFLCLKERFTTYKLENVMRLRSVYSIRIYELLKQYQRIGKRTITIDGLRSMLGIEPKEYHLYGDFKRFVILVAHKEINEKTDISFDFREKKLGRKVNEIEFVINKKETESKSERLKRQREAKKRERKEQDDTEKALQRQRIDDYLAQLSPEEQKALTAEAETLARKEGSAFMKERKITEPILNGYRLEIIGKRLAKR